MAVLSEWPIRSEPALALAIARAFIDTNSRNHSNWFQFGALPARSIRYPVGPKSTATIQQRILRVSRHKDESYHVHKDPRSSASCGPLVGACRHDACRLR
jgi:hypothetical protein